MNHKLVFTFLASLLIASIILSYGFLIVDPPREEPQDLFVGIDVAYENITEIKALIDKVSSYTNLFVIGCTGITYNTTRLNETCQYIYDKGLNFMVYRDTPLRNATWAEKAKKTWGDRFLGYYAYDELGGWQIDMNEWRLVLDAENYSDAANSFVSIKSGSWTGLQGSATPPISAYTLMTMRCTGSITKQDTTQSSHNSAGITAGNST